MFRPLAAVAALLGAGVGVFIGCVGDDPLPSAAVPEEGGSQSTSDASGAPAADAGGASDSGACESTLPADASCYSGPAGTRGIGRCKDGTLTCTSAGTTVCEGEVQPAATDPCNEVDDDCNGTVDDGVDKTTTAHCGTCTNTCEASDVCDEGVCKKPAVNCEQVACADPSCAGQSCGLGCLCAAGKKTETACGNGLDDDNDQHTDCDDSDCLGKTCATGKTCKAGGACN